MATKNPYEIIKHQLVTEKSMMLGRLKDVESNKSVKSFKSPKFVFVVDKSANKFEIAQALEEIYKKEGIKVVAVNTINVKSKARRVRGRSGFTSPFKKAVVTLRPDDKLDNV